MDGRGSKVAVREAWRLLWVLCVLLCAVEPVGAQPQKVYDINLPAQTLADGLNGLSEQTGVPVLFPFDLVKDRTAPAVVGHYGVFEALEALLKGSGLSGDLSEKGVLTVFASDSGANRHRETILNQHDTTKNSNDGPIQKHGRLATFFAALGTAFSASAQTVGNDTAPVADVVITAQKHEERLQDVPVPVTVLNSEELTGNNQVLLRDYASSVPGFNVTPNYVATQNLSIRGVTTGGSSTPTVGVTIDDVPFGASAGPHANHVPDVDPGDLARIEVLRGPQGTLYGADSMGGLLKFVTLDPSSKEYSGRIEAGTSDVYHGAEPGYDMRAAANVPVTDSFAMRISAFRRQDPGYIDNPTLHINGVNEDTADGGRFSALWRASESFSVKLSALYQEIEANGLDEVDTPTAAFPPTLGLRGLQQSSIQGVGAQHTAIQAYSATVKAHFSGVDLTSLTGYNVVKESDSLDWGFAFGAPVLSAFGVSGTGYFEADDFNKVTQEIRLEGSFWDRFSWLLGGFYTHENDQGHFNAAAVDTANGQIVGWFWNKFQEVPDRFQEYAPFADLTYKFSDQFDLQVGARESYIERTLQQTFQTGPYTVQVLHKPEPVISPPTAYKDRALTYLATPRLKLSQEFLLYARFASGYRPGTPNLPTLNVPRESSADRTKNYEIGAKGDFFDRHFSLDTSIYYIDWTDIQITQIDPTTHYVFNTNGSRAKSEGVELSVTARPSSGLTVGGWVTYDDAVLTEPFPSNSSIYGASGDRLPLTSRYSGNLSLEQSFHISDNAVGYVGAEASYVGNRIGVFTANSVRQSFPAYTKTDLRAGVRTEDWTVNFYVNNLADARGLIDGGVGYFYPPARVYITPRTVGVNVVRTF